MKDLIQILATTALILSSVLIGMYICATKYEIKEIHSSSWILVIIISFFALTKVLGDDN